MPKSRNRKKPKRLTEPIITQSDRERIAEAQLRKHDEYMKMELADLMELQKGGTVKGSYLKALDYVIGYKLSTERSYGPLTAI